MMGMYDCCSLSRPLNLSRNFTHQTVFGRITARDELRSLLMSRRTTHLFTLNRVMTYEGYTHILTNRPTVNLRFPHFNQLLFNVPYQAIYRHLTNRPLFASLHQVAPQLFPVKRFAPLILLDNEQI